MQSYLYESSSLFPIHPQDVGLRESIVIFRNDLVTFKYGYEYKQISVQTDFVYVTKYFIRAPPQKKASAFSLCAPVHSQFDRI